MKEPKIVQIAISDLDNTLTVLYDDGRVYRTYRLYTEDLKSFAHQWQEISYPIPRIPIPPEAARRSARPKNKRK